MEEGLSTDSQYTLGIFCSDRIRTTSNTMTIIIGAVLIDKLCKATLNASQEQALETKPTDTEASIQVVNENGATESTKL